MNKLGEGQGEVGYRKAQRACDAGRRPLRPLPYLGRNRTQFTMDQIRASDARRHLSMLLDRVVHGKSPTNGPSDWLPYLDCVKAKRDRRRELPQLLSS